jgi:hypothetical protein
VRALTFMCILVLLLALGMFCKCNADPLIKLVMLLEANSAVNTKSMPTISTMSQHRTGHTLRVSSHEAGRQEQLVMGCDLVGRSKTTIFRQGSGCLCPHHSWNFGMLIWLCQWKKKCTARSLLEVTRIWGKKGSFCMTVLPCR